MQAIRIEEKKEEKEEKRWPMTIEFYVIFIVRNPLVEQNNDT